MSKVKLIIKVGGAIAGILGVGCAIGAHAKTKAICKRMDESMEGLIGELSKKIEGMDISDEIINRAVDEAVSTKVDIIVRRSRNNVVNDIERDMRDQVKSIIDSEYKNIRNDITDKVSKEVSKINTRDIEAEIIEKAKREVAKKFDNSLDDILEKYNHDLDNVSKIYKSIAQTMTKDNSKEMIFKM